MLGPVQMWVAIRAAAQMMEVRMAVAEMGLDSDFVFVLEEAA